ncbi:MAG: metallophosphoesterase [Acidaminococcaceae bacterium]|nr:metallophosphoesterase [Acidaminococcaceae bacterium]
MNIYAIGDLHLSGDPPRKPMDIFGERWRGHKEKIKTDWLQKVSDEDTVIICGDISWAMNLREAQQDLTWLAALPGRKILLRGNHDYWWDSMQKMQNLYGNAFDFLQNNCYETEAAVICGTRGWTLPSVETFTEEDEKIYAREGIRLELSLKSAQQRFPSLPQIVALHYPPLFKSGERNLFTELLEKYQVQHCVFGHIHGENCEHVFEGVSNEVNYKLVSCDTQNFSLCKIL